MALVQAQRDINHIKWTPKKVSKLTQLIATGQYEYPWARDVELIAADEEGEVEVETLKYHGKQILLQDEIKPILKDMYHDIANGGFRGRASFWNLVHSKYLGVTQKDVNDYMDGDELASKYNKSFFKARNTRPLVVRAPGRYWMMDYMFLDEKVSNQYKSHDGKWLSVLNVIDCFSKRVWLFLTEDKTDETTVDCLRNIFKTEQPKVMHSDNGKEFKNQAMEAFLKRRGVKHVLGPEYSPNAQAIVERSNGTFKEMLRKIFSVEVSKPLKEQRTMKEMVQLIQDNMNNSYHSSIKGTPNEIHKLTKDDPRVIAIYNSMKQNLTESLARHRVLQGKELKSKYKVGESVRVDNRIVEPDQMQKPKLERGPHFSDQVFTISKVTDKKVYLDGGQRLDSNRIRKVKGQEAKKV